MDAARLLVSFDGDALAVQVLLVLLKTPHVREALLAQSGRGGGKRKLSVLIIPSFTVKGYH